MVTLEKQMSLGEAADRALDFYRDSWLRFSESPIVCEFGRASLRSDRRKRNPLPSSTHSRICKGQLSPGHCKTIPIQETPVKKFAPPQLS